MKESKFIELLNLYVDHQITPGDAALLEAEVRSNPERRRIYRQYCQMQKACVELGDTFRSDSAAPVVPSKVVDFSPRRSRLAWLNYAGGVAALAACVAVAFVLRSRMAPAIAPAPVVAVATVPAAPVVAPVTTPVFAARPALLPAFGLRSFALHDQGSDFAESNTVPQIEFADWMNDIRFTAMDANGADVFHFDGKAPLRSDSRTFRSTRPLQGKVEMTAFKFQR